MMRREENEAETEELLFFLKLSKFRRWKIGAAEVDGVMRAECGEEGRGGPSALMPDPHLSRLNLL